MEKLLITLGTVDYNTTAIAGTWNLDDLTNGELAVFDQDGTVVSMLAPAITGDTFSIAVGRSTGADSTGPINIDTLRWIKQTYLAPVAKVMFIGDDIKIQDVMVNFLDNLNIKSELFFNDDTYCKTSKKLIIAIVNDKWKYKLIEIQKKYPEIGLLYFGNNYSVNIITNYIKHFIGG